MLQSLVDAWLADARGGGAASHEASAELLRLKRAVR
ncbi:hypothetical protein GGR11_002600 [Brevundimonas mediterranea]|uniref:Uncharacterized protein n=1 Tax=Brevundimonas mediterranea TaxID=74329 RepID=A0A7W6A6G9_9CAUL|nr:hypothetical protein [Brevundimonas mediterranea]